MITVVRYFGGVKLGAGGLTRAYGQAAQAVMEVLPVVEQVPQTQMMVECDFSQEQYIRHLCQQHQAEVTQVDYTHQVSMAITLPTENCSQFQAQLEANSCHYTLP